MNLSIKNGCAKFADPDPVPPRKVLVRSSRSPRSLFISIGESQQSHNWTVHSPITALDRVYPKVPWCVQLVKFNGAVAITRDTVSLITHYCDTMMTLPQLL